MSHHKNNEPSGGLGAAATDGTHARTGSVTIARLAALALIAVLALGLAYLRLAPDSDAISVPPRAKAGDLIVKPGTFETEAGARAADIGTLVLPENHNHPNSRLIAVPVIRIRAKSDHPAEPIFRLEGGPGGTNMEFEQASRYADNHDVVLVGYRGVEGSSVLKAPEVESAIAHSRDFLSEESYRAYGDAQKAAAERFKAEGVDLTGYTPEQVVEDLEAARAAFGYERVDLISESAGTRTAMIYAWRHPERVHRSIMIGVNPPGNFVWDAKATDEQLDRYSAHYAKYAGTAKRTDDLSATMRQTNAKMPDRWLFLPIKKGNVRVATFMGMAESTAKAGPFNAPLFLDAWLSAADGDASAFWGTTLVTDLLFPKLSVWGQYAAFANTDAQAARDYFSSGPSPDANLGRAASAFAWGAGQLSNALPPDPEEKNYSQPRTSEVETLLIGGELDMATPPQIATKQLLPYLPNGHQVLLAGIGHSGSFWRYQTQAGTRLVNTYFDTGRVDDSLYQPGIVDFKPQLALTTISKWIFGVMFGLAFFMVASLVGMAARVINRGRFGRMGSGFLRSLYPMILGLGGWTLGALIVMSTLPTVPLTSELLVALSMGVPIGLAVYLAWFDRSMTAGTRTTGLAAALGAALVGAWLGFNVTDGMLALVTPLVGAVLGANVALIGLDLIWDRSAGPAAEHAPATTHSFNDIALEA